MPRGGAHFSTEELVRVLSYYDIGIIMRIKPLSGGNRRAPKMVVLSEHGRFLLKRRPRGKGDLDRVAFAHAVQARLGERRFPVTKLLATRDQHSTVLRLDHHIYELFEFVSGVRYDGSPEATTDAGRQLANFHRCLSDFSRDWEPLQASFHDSSSIRTHLKTIGSDRGARSGEELHATAEMLMVLYNKSSVRVNQLGFDAWTQQIIHGDWHPGNMLFCERRVAVVLDFDSLRLAPPSLDLANGMLQFSIVGGRPNPADWPDYFDRDRLLQFLNGYRSVMPLDMHVLDALPDLMIETMIAEAVLPIAATGFFGHLHGSDFLQMIRRKAEWLHKNRDQLTNLIVS